MQTPITQILRTTLFHTLIFIQPLPTTLHKLFKMLTMDHALLIILLTDIQQAGEILHLPVRMCTT